jgi:hypothetical protein
MTSAAEAIDAVRQGPKGPQIGAFFEHILCTPVEVAEVRQRFVDTLEEWPGNEEVS